MDFNNYNRTQKQLILFFGGIGFCFVAYYLLSEGFSGKYPDFWIIVLGTFFGIWGICSIYVFFNYERFEHSSTYHSKKLPYYSQERKVKIIIMIVAVMFSSPFFYGSYHLYIEKGKKNLDSDFVTIKGIVTNDGQIYKGRKGSSLIYIHLQKYQDFAFSVTGIAFSAIDREKYVKNVKMGDTISVIIKRDEYKMKLTHEKALRFFDKTVNYKFIDVYGVQDKDYKYLTLKQYNKAHLEDTNWDIIFILSFAIFGFCIIVTAINMIK